MVFVVAWLAVVQTVFVFAWSLDKLRDLALAEHAGWARFAAWLAMVTTGAVVMFGLVSALLGYLGFTKSLLGGGK